MIGGNYGCFPLSGFDNWISGFVYLEFPFLSGIFFWGTSWILFIILAFVYDNLVLSLGIWVGQSELFEMLSIVRYLLHVLLIPTLVYVSLDIMRRIRIEWSEYFVTHVVYHLYTFS